MTDDFFQQQPHESSPRNSKTWWNFITRTLFYTSLVGFILGAAFGYLHIKGWLKNAEEGLVLYAITFGGGAFVSASFVLYQARQGQLKMQKIKVRQK
jgi:hypothetical protein